MKKIFSQLNQLVKEESKGVHIYYNITDPQAYINNLVAYIQSGVEQGDNILVIESERILPQIKAELAKVLTGEQLKTIHTINNFDYYCSSGSFQPAVIFEHLGKTLEPFIENNISFRIWAHVEWGEQEGIIPILEEFENEADRVVTEQGMYLVCAYDKERVPESLETKLMKCHKYTLVNNEIVLSNLYHQD